MRKGIQPHKATQEVLLCNRARIVCVCVRGGSPGKFVLKVRNYERGSVISIDTGQCLGLSLSSSV